MKRYNKAIDYALLAMHYARKAEMSKSASVKASFRKKAISAMLNSGKQADTLEGMKTLEASLRIAAENEGMLPPIDDEMDMEDMPMEAEDEMMDDVDVDDVNMDIQEVSAEAEDDEDEDEEEDEDDEDEDEDEAVEAFNRVAARVRARRLAARKLQARKQLAARARKAMARRLAARRATR